MSRLPLVMAMLWTISFVQAAEPVKPEPQQPAGADAEAHWMIKIRVCQGDLAKRDNPAEIKVLSAPQVICVDGMPFSVMTGGNVMVPHVPHAKRRSVNYGLEVLGKCQKLDDETVQLDLKCQRTALVSNTQDDLEIKGNSLHAIKRLKLGKMTTLGINEGEESNQSWIEVTVTDAKE